VPSPTPLSLVLQAGISPDAAYSGLADTYIDGVAPLDRNYGQAHELKLYWNGRKKTLLRFDLSAHLPATAVVLSARLELYAYTAWYEGRSTTVGAYEALRPWNEGEATWADAAADTPWAEEGCEGESDRALEPVAAATLERSGRWYVWQSRALASLVQRWVASPATNLGLVLAPVQGSFRQEWLLHSAQNVRDPALSPRLVLSYYPAPARHGIYLPAVRRGSASATDAATGQIPGRSWRGSIWEQ
jgi:hypothetical protein